MTTKMTAMAIMIIIIFIFECFYSVLAWKSAYKTIYNRKLIHEKHY